jgi:hypothetical protein
MCWNEQVSLNTFLFSSFVLILIFYNNTFTQYKVPGFNNKWIYLFFVSFISMQLIEFFIWRNLNNKFYNRVFSIAAMTLILLQPVFSLMIISNNATLRNYMLFAYLLCSIPIASYNFLTNTIYSSRAENGHLHWNFITFSPIFIIGWLFFFLFSFVYEKYWAGLICALFLYFVSFYNYYKDKTVSSMWCWLVNSVMIFYAVYLLLYLPFREYNRIC